MTYPDDRKHVHLTPMGTPSPSVQKILLFDHVCDLCLTRRPSNPLFKNSQLIENCEVVNSLRISFCKKITSRKNFYDLGYALSSRPYWVASQFSSDRGSAGNFRMRSKYRNRDRRLICSALAACLGTLRSNGEPLPCIRFERQL